MKKTYSKDGNMCYTTNSVSIKVLDNYRRLPIPKEYIRALHLDSRDLVELYLDNDKIIIKKHILNEETQNHIEALRSIAKAKNKDISMILNILQNELV